MGLLVAHRLSPAQGRPTRPPEGEKEEVELRGEEFVVVGDDFSRDGDDFDGGDEK